MLDLVKLVDVLVDKGVVGLVGDKVLVEVGFLDKIGDLVVVGVDDGVVVDDLSILSGKVKKEVVDHSEVP